MREDREQKQGRGIWPGQDTKATGVQGSAHRSPASLTLDPDSP